MQKDGLMVKDMSVIILVCGNLEDVLTRTYVQTKVSLSNQFCLRKKRKKTANM